MKTARTRRVVLLFVGLLGYASLAGAQSPQPGEAFDQVDGGENFTCAMHAKDGTVACWGLGTAGTYKNDDYGQARPPEGVTFKQVSAGKYHACGVKTEGYAACWGWNDVPYTEDSGTDVRSTFVGQATPPQGVLFDSMSTGYYHSCGLKLDGSADCWGYNYDPYWNHLGQAEDRTGPFKQVSSGAWHNCAIRKSDDMVECWGGNGYGQSKPPAYRFKKIASGQHFTCGIRMDSDSAIDGDVACWGANTYFQAPNKVDGPFVDVAAGDLFACAKRADGTMDCWGYYLYGQNKEPAGKFATFGLGDAHGCAVYATGETYAGQWLCWGKDSHGQAPYNTALPPKAGTPEYVAPVVRIDLTPAEPDRADGYYTGPVVVNPVITDDSDIADVRCVLDPAAAPASFNDLPSGTCRFVGGESVDVGGAHAFYLAAKDVYGNVSNVVSVAFSIDWPFDFGGFLPPLRHAPALNSIQAGQTVPVKFRVAGDYRLALGSVLVASGEVSCRTLRPTGAPWSIHERAATGSIPRAPGNGQVTYPWKVPRQWPGTCRALGVRLADGLWHYAYFKLAASTAQASVVTIDFGSAATGSSLITSPLVTPAGTVTLSSTNGGLSLLTITAASGKSLHYTQNGNNAARALLSFDFDVSSVTFDYSGYALGDFLGEALDVHGNVVASFTKTGTVCSSCFDGQNVVLSGVGIRAFRFADTSEYNDVVVDNLRLEVSLPGPA